MKPGRNDPCPCGSGKKFKQCCEGKVQPRPVEPSPAEISQLLTLYSMGRHAELEAGTRALLERHPRSGLAWKILGAALQGQGRDALPALHKAVELMPNDAEAHNNLGNALHRLGQLDAAVASCRRAVQLNPGFPEAHNNLGNALQDLRQLQESAASYRRALQLRPDFAQAHYNLGGVLKELGQFQESAASYRRALQLTPGSPVVLHNLGGVLQDLGQIDEAIACYRQALAVAPHFTDTHSNLLFAMNYGGTHAPEAFLAEARKFAGTVTRNATAPFSAWLSDPQPARLRVGIVSGDLRIHSVGHFLAGLLAHIDQARIELIAYPSYDKEDELSVRLKRHFAEWKPLVGLNDEQAARLIHADGVHVLLDLSGHTAANRLPVFAWKPAPVQATWLGLPVTTGMTEMDYVLGDAQAIPPGHEAHFAEAVWRMLDSYVCFAAPSDSVQVGPLPALNTGRVTFGSFNNLTKMTDAVVAAWARILSAVPDSRLYLKTAQLDDAVIRAQVLKRFAAHAIAPERLLLKGKLGSIAAHLAEYHNVDIALDTFPYPGITTSIEALWMGVPVLSLHGDRFLSLSAASIAHHAGLDDWVAQDIDDYVAQAVAHASGLDHLAALRGALRPQVLASPLFDAPRFARNFEDALWDMWRDKMRRTVQTDQQ